MKITLKPRRVQFFVKIALLYAFWKRPDLDEIGAIRAWFKELHELDSEYYYVPFAAIRPDRCYLVYVKERHWKPKKAVKNAKVKLAKNEKWILRQIPWKTELNRIRLNKKNPQWP